MVFDLRIFEETIIIKSLLYTHFEKNLYLDIQ